MPTYSISVEDPTGQSTKQFREVVADDELEATEQVIEEGFEILGVQEVPDSIDWEPTPEEEE